MTDPDTLDTITIMDRNLWAEMSGTNEESYWLYFQWWNNRGVEEVNDSNKTTDKAKYEDSYYGKWYNGYGLFIAWNTDYRENGNHYNNLWWSDLGQSWRQWACPEWYHIPTIQEWNQLISIWWKIHTRDVVKNEDWEIVPKSRYAENTSDTEISSFKASVDTECITEDDIEEIISIFSS